jgi:small-conductance mechanosensitive channel
MIKLIAGWWLLVLAMVFAGTPVLAQTPADTPAQVRQLLDLLRDPAVRAWLERERALGEPAAAAAPASDPVTGQLDAIRNQIAGLGAAVPRLPIELGHIAETSLAQVRERGILPVLVILVGFLALGGGLEWLYWRLSRRNIRWLIGQPLDSVSNRLMAVAVRLGFGIGAICCFALGSVGAFLAFDWPPLLRLIVLNYLLALLALRMSVVLGRFLLAPGGERFRIVPMDTARAWFWHRRLTVLVGWIAFAIATINFLAPLGLSYDVANLIISGLSLVTLLLTLEVVWRRPAPVRIHPLIGPRALSVLATIFFLAQWVLRAIGATGIMWTLAVVVGLPVVIGVVQRSVNHLLRPPGSEHADQDLPTVLAVCLERGLRAVLIIGSALLLARAWQVDLGALTVQDTLSTRAIRGVLSGVMVLLIADFLWHLVKTLIDRKLAEAHAATETEGDIARRMGRLRTLLPILRNVLFIVFSVMAVLMVLAGLGIEVGPLVAGAGVVGVAVGFGAQTLVKDIISGMFFLLDDAFRVGEYIQSGAYKGTVESFSLRSVKLRHHRGPLFTVPFGSLGAIQNMSRDWVIDKFSIRITYDSDIEKARKLVKQIGQDLAADPEFAADIIEPMKMQGVEAFSDFAVEMRVKMMTKPGQQFTIRRKAYALIKKAFEANGIKFAMPTVQVSGGDDAVEAAVARTALDAAEKPAPSAA